MPQRLKKETPSLALRTARLVFLLVCVCALGFVSSLFITPDALGWYHSLPLSRLTPPDMLFSLVWIILYVLMAIAAFLVWNKASPRFFALQLICAAFWPFVFFYLHSVAGGAVVILAMVVFLALTIKVFYPASKVAAFLLVPQLIWGVFALYLNCALLFG